MQNSIECANLLCNTPITMKEPKLLNHLKHHEDKVNTVVLSRDGGLLATASFDGTVLMYDVQSKQTVIHSVIYTLSWTYHSPLKVIDWLVL